MTSLEIIYNCFDDMFEWHTYRIADRFMGTEQEYYGYRAIPENIRLRRIVKNFGQMDGGWYIEIN